MIKPLTAPSTHENQRMQPLHPLKHPGAWLRAFWRFSRPHTIIGTTCSTLSLVMIVMAALPSPKPWESAAIAFLTAWIACLCGNVYIVGLNQLEDVAIDRINKPHLPVASGAYTRQVGRWIVGVMGAGAIALSIISGNPFLMFTVVSSLLIGTAYSLPPIRLKRFPFWASMCILVVRGVIVNLGLYLFFATQLGLPALVPARVWALTAFVIVFSFAIAIFKDIPDLVGDRQFNISTYTVRLGQKRVFDIARGVLTACYVGMMAIAPFLAGVHSLFLILAQGIGILFFWERSRRVDLDHSPITKDLTYPTLYQFIWKLFFVEYAIFAVACWFAR